MMRLGVLADIHGNLPALDAVVDDLDRRGVDGVVDLGDCVSGPLWPRETLQRLQALGWPTVRGNHDRQVALLPRAELGPTDAFAFDALGEDERRRLGALPSSITLQAGIVAFHARPDHDDGYLLEDVVDGRLRDASPAVVAERLGCVAARVILTAHSHRAAALRLPDGRWVLNPGSVGCPAYTVETHPAHVSETQTPLARYAVASLDVSGAVPTVLAVDFVAVAYEADAASRRAALNGRPDWAHALATGRMLHT